MKKMFNEPNETYRNRKKTDWFFQLSTKTFIKVKF